MKGEVYICLSNARKHIAKTTERDSRAGPSPSSRSTLSRKRDTSTPRRFTAGPAWQNIMLWAYGHWTYLIISAWRPVDVRFWRKKTVPALKGRWVFLDEYSGCHNVALYSYIIAVCYVIGDPVPIILGFILSKNPSHYKLDLTLIIILKLKTHSVYAYWKSQYCVIYQLWYTLSDMKGCICHFVKWHIIIYTLSNPRVYLARCVADTPSPSWLWKGVSATSWEGYSVNPLTAGAAYIPVFILY